MPQRDSKIESGNLCMNGLMINIHIEVKYGKQYLSVKKKNRISFLNKAEICYVLKGYGYFPLNRLS